MTDALAETPTVPHDDPELEAVVAELYRWDWSSTILLAGVASRAWSLPARTLAGQVEACIDREPNCSGSNRLKDTGATEPATHASADPRMSVDAVFSLRAYSDTKAVEGLHRRWWDPGARCQRRQHELPQPRGNTKPPSETVAAERVRR